MKKSIQKVILSSLMILFSITTAMAQMVEVVPGSKGALPAPPAIAEAQEGHFGSLALKQVSLQSEYMFSYYRYYLEARLEYRPVSDFGGDSYTIQYHTANSDTWETVNDEQLWYNQYGEAWVEIDHDGSKAWPITYRLKLNGGPMDGWVSNEVIAEKPYKAIYAGIGYSEPNFIYAGLKVYSHYIDCKVIPAEEQKEKRWIDISRNDVKVSYQWYLRNPNTYEMTKIQGATSGTYTPTTEQTGYELVSEVEGTYNNAYVKTQHSFGVIKLPILASLEYAGPELEHFKLTEIPYGFQFKGRHGAYVVDVKIKVVTRDTDIFYDIQYQKGTNAPGKELVEEVFKNDRKVFYDPKTPCTREAVTCIGEYSKGTLGTLKKKKSK